MKRISRNEKVQVESSELKESLEKVKKSQEETIKTKTEYQNELNFLISLRINKKENELILLQTKFNHLNLELDKLKDSRNELLDKKQDRPLDSKKRTEVKLLEKSARFQNNLFKENYYKFDPGYEMSFSTTLKNLFESIEKRDRKPILSGKILNVTKTMRQTQKVTKFKREKEEYTERYSSSEDSEESKSDTETSTVLAKVIDKAVHHLIAVAEEVAPTLDQKKKKK
ncbi:unnamed protein product [Brachionus calyciflorus]|uniref:Uncharacterized protein n=1 Tax=Brachionus calyciflorus TaxID=104777 RepID=A0A813UY91_9BILA|nr:unnamed protein product [Brachionus calyciflorus]